MAMRHDMRRSSVVSVGLDFVINGPRPLNLEPVVEQAPADEVASPTFAAAEGTLSFEPFEPQEEQQEPQICVPIQTVPV